MSPPGEGDMGHGTWDMSRMSHNVPKCPLRRGGHGTWDMSHGRGDVGPAAGLLGEMSHNVQNEPK
jgi:hypothetical protein